jgi:NAD(P)H-dependent FMN reductase
MRWFYFILAVITLSWVGLTIYVQRDGQDISVDIDGVEPSNKALVVFDPDPFYNLDQQLCKVFGETINQYQWQVNIRSVSMALNVQTFDYDLIVLCANTYNWAPDNSLVKWLKRINLNQKPVVLLTLGGGSTARAQGILEDLVSEQGAIILGSEEFWSWRPNDENRTELANNLVAQNLVKDFAKEMIKKL